MNRTKKIFLIIAVCCILAGTGLSVLALYDVGFDLRRMNTEEINVETYDINEEFKNIEINAVECDIRILPSNDRLCHVVCTESEKVKYDVKVENDTLFVSRRDNRKWYELFGLLGVKDISVTVYLPEEKYDFVYLKTVSGNVNVPRDFEFDQAEIYSTSGDISFLSKRCEDAFIKTTSGDIEIKDTEGNKAEIISVSGDIFMSGVKSGAINIKTTSGDFEAQSVLLSGEASIESVSGEVTLTESDADSLRIKTTSGDVEGRFLTPKQLITETSSGNVNAYTSDPNGGECHVTTVSGDISIMAAE